MLHAPVPPLLVGLLGRRTEEGRAPLAAWVRQEVSGLLLLPAAAASLLRGRYAAS
jgi:hypothetical protein